MKLTDAEREALKGQLEWLRLMGVSEVPIRSAGTAAAQAGAARQDRPDPEAAHQEGGPAPIQTGLFGAPEQPALSGPAAAGSARRGRTRSEEPASSPLAGLMARASADPAEALRQIREEIGDCRRCRLSEKRTHVVFGVGNPAARLMFVGEGPGADEDAQGEPFVGRAGQLLTKIIEAMNLKRADVYIANIVKCRPPENRTPLPDETATCSPFLFRQIAAIGPRVIVCLGTPSAQTLLGTRETITRLRGVFREIEGIKVMPTFHPAYLLRNPAAKREVWEDMKQVMAALQGD